MEPLRNPECLTDVRARVTSIGGGIVFAICLAVTALFIITLSTPSVTSSQRIIVFMLTVATWGYLLSSSTERLCLRDRSIVYTSILGRKKIVPLVDLDEMLLVHQGFNLERGIETIEFRRHEKDPERLALGPCWHRHELEAFLHSVEEAMNDPQLLEEVR